MEGIWFIIGLVITGLIVGALGRLAVPGRDPMGILTTILVGIGGSFIGGLVGRAIFGPDSPAPFIFAVAGAALIVFIMRKVRERR